MVALTGYRKGKNKKDKMLGIRMTSDEYQDLQRLANHYTGGNVSDLVRIITDKLTKGEILGEG